MSANCLQRQLQDAHPRLAHITEHVTSHTELWSSMWREDWVAFGFKGPCREAVRANSRAHLTSATHL